MNNLNNYELEIINNFIGGFSASTERILSRIIDDNVFNKFDFAVDSSMQIEDLSVLKEKNAICKIDYKEGYKQDSLYILIPEEFIGAASNVLMGNDKRNDYTGSLSKAQIDTFINILRDIFNDITNIFEEIYKRSLQFDENILIIDKKAENYNEVLNAVDLDLAVKHILTVNNEKRYQIFLLLNSEKTKNSLIANGLLENDRSDSQIAINLGLASIDINQITDIKIDISAELGRSKISLKNVLGLADGSIVELDSLNDSDITVFANGLEVAKAQIVVIDDNFGIRITKIISPQERLKEL